MVLRLLVLATVVGLIPACAAECNVAPPVLPADPCPPTSVTTCPSSQYCQPGAVSYSCVARKAFGPCLRGAECISGVCLSNGQCEVLSCP